MEPTPFQLLIINLVLVEGILSIIFGFMWYYVRDCRLHPEKHKYDFKPRSPKYKREER